METYFKGIVRNSKIKRFAPVLAVFLCFSCGGKTKYESQLVLKNELTTAISVRVYPKTKFVSSGDMYKPSPSSNVYFAREFVVQGGSEQTLYFEARFGIKPSELARTVFDSVKIQSDQTIIKLGHTQRVGYLTNPFVDDSNWEFEKRLSERPTQLKRNPVESENYYFVIREENIIR